MHFRLIIIFSVLIENCKYIFTENCHYLNVAIYQKVERLGFHRDLNWLIEPLHVDTESWEKASCKVALMLEIPQEIYVDIDQINNLQRLGKLHILIKGDVNIEAPAHEASKHTVYIYLNSSKFDDKIALKLPIHLRYQKSYLGGYGKASLNKVNLLVKCDESQYKICNSIGEITAPESLKQLDVISWNNITYKSDFQVVELLVPIGDLNHYPFVAVFTCILGCAGCIYLLSIVTNTKNLF